MSSSLRIIVTGLIAPVPLTRGFLEHGFITRTEDRPATIGLPKTATFILPVPQHHGAPSLGAGRHCAFQILKFADPLLNLSGSGMERKTPASPSARIHIDSDLGFTQVKLEWEGELRDAVQLKAVNE